MCWKLFSHVWASESAAPQRCTLLELDDYDILRFRTNMHGTKHARMCKIMRASVTHANNLTNGIRIEIIE